MPDPDNQTTGGLPPVEQTPSGALSPQYYATVNKKLQDPDSTAKLRERLEKFLEERESPMNLILGGLKDATAWTGGGIEGPTATLATRDRQKSSEFDNLFKMQQEMAQIKAAEDQQRDYANRMRDLGTGVFGTAGAGSAQGAGGAGGDMVPYMGIMIPRERALAMIKAPNQAAHDKIFNEYIHELDKSRLGMEYNPSTYDQKEIAVGNQIKSANAMELKRIDSIAKKENIPFKEAAKKYFEGQSGAAPAGQPAQTPSAPVSGQQPTSAPVKSPEILKAIQTGTLGRESSFGAADTSKPGIQGAIGPGQITPDTFQTAKNLKLIPQDYDINKPKQNIDASNKLIEHYYNKYDGDVDKTLAAYHGGEGAINKDGSINLDRKDKLGTSIRDYISSTKKIAGLSGATAETAVNRLGQSAQATTTPVQEKSLSELKSDLEVRADVAKKERGKLAEGYVADVQDVQANKALSGQTLASANAVNRIVDKHKDVFGMLQHPTVAAAFAGLIQSGAHAAGIQASMPGLTAAIRKVMPGVTDDDIVAVQQVGAELARFKLLDARTYLKGQGAVSDMERNLISELSGSIDSSPKAIRSFMEWRIMRAQYDKEIGEEYRKWSNKNPDASSKEFINSDKVANMRDAYDKKLEQFSSTFGLGQSGSSGKKEETKPHPGKSLVDKYAPR